MTPQSPRLHLELGPVLVNRTAVYQMCKAAPRELLARGFDVASSALVARLNLDAEPQNRDEARWIREQPKHHIRNFSEGSYRPAVEG